MKMKIANMEMLTVATLAANMEMLTVATLATATEGSYVLDMIRQQLKEVKDSRVVTLQFIDRNIIHGTRVRHFSVPFLGRIAA